MRPAEITGATGSEGPEIRIIGRNLKLDNPVVRALAGSTFLALPLLLLTAVVALLAGPPEQQVLQNFLVSLVAVVGFGIYSGNTGIMTFGHVAFMGIAAYASGILTMPTAIKELALPQLLPALQDIQLPLVPATVVALAVVAAVALLFGVPFSRLSAAATPIATLSMLMITYVILAASGDLTRGSQTFYGVPADVTLPIALGVAIGVMLVARLFRESTTGLRIRASREDELAARSMGINIPSLRLVAWVLSALVVGLAGVMLGHTLTAFSPKQFYFTLQFALVAMLVVGGPTTVTGAIGGAFVVSLAMEMARRLEGALSGLSIGGATFGGVFGLQEVTLGLMIIAVMYRRRDGLFGRLELDEVLLGRWLRRRGATASDEGAPPGPRASASRTTTGGADTEHDI